jgi:RNA recognition motif-containing protein
VPKVKEGRIIIRNLPFDLKEIHLQKDFKKYGNLLQVNVPIKNENNLNRGFAFLEYSTKEEA